MGDFISADSVRVSPVPDPAMGSPFAYVGDSPLSSTDPTGHCGGLFSFLCAVMHPVAHAVHPVAHPAAHPAARPRVPFSYYYMMIDTPGGAAAYACGELGVSVVAEAGQLRVPPPPAHRRHILEFNKADPACNAWHNPLNVLAGMGATVAGLGDAVECSGAVLPLLLQCLRDVLTGNLPSQAYARWVASHGIDTSFTHGPYAFGEFLAGLLTLPLSDGGGAADSAIADGADATGATAEAATAPADGAPAEAAPAAGDRPPSPPCGGQSFTAATPVLLASGKTEPISKLHPGQEVLATSTRTGKNQPEAITAVLLHHDTDLYDLKVREHGHATVIHTTASHLFWDPYLHQ